MAKEPQAAPKNMRLCANGFVDVNVGEVQNHYGVPFMCEECDGKQDGETVKTRRLVAELPTKEAQAMIDAGRAVAIEG